MIRKNEFTVFISYFGTNLQNGSKGLSMQAKAIIDASVGGKSYCGPDEDEHTYQQHMNEVIPASSLFLMVVNDSIPQDASGAISDQSKYMIYEIGAFVELVRRGKRNPKDFAALYVGNRYFELDEKFRFVQTLLRNVDPNGLLSSGNHHFIQDFGTLPKWVDIRLNQPAEDILENESLHMTFLHDKVNAFLETQDKGLMLLEMDEGMGKTTFIRQREQMAKKLGGQKSLFFYVSGENNYEQIVDFGLEAYRDLTEGLDFQQKRGLAHIDPFQPDMGKAFSDFINQAKSAAYSDTKIVFYLDNVGFLGSISGKTIFDYFRRAQDWCSGIYVVATSRSASWAVADWYTDGVPLTQFSLSRTNMQYKNFLRLFYNERIVPALKNLGVSQIREIRDAIEPKTILMYTLYQRILKVYAWEHREEQGNYEDLKDVDTLVAYYFRTLQEHYSRSTFDDYKKILYLLSVSETALEQEDILYLIREQFIRQNYLDESDPKNFLFRVFTHSAAENGKTYYTLLHNGVRCLLDFDEVLVDEVNTKLYSQLIGVLERRCCNLTALFDEGKTLFRFLRPLLSSENLDREDRDYLLSLIGDLPFDNGWNKDAAFRDSEELLLQIVSDFGRSTIPKMKVAKCLSVLGNDLFIDGRAAWSDHMLREAVDLYDDTLPEKMTQDELYDFQELKSLVATCAQALKDHDTPVQAYEEVIVYLKMLYDQKYPRADAVKYVRNVACLGHVYGHAGIFDKQIRTLERAETLYREMNLDNLPVLAFISFGKAYYYFDTADYRLAYETATRTIDAYFRIREVQKEQFYYGDIIDCMRLRFETVFSCGVLQTDEIIDFVITQYRKVQKMQRRDREHNYLYNIGADEALAKLQYLLDRKREAKRLCRRIIEMIEKEKLDEDDDHFMEVKQRILELLQQIECDFFK